MVMSNGVIISPNRPATTHLTVGPAGTWTLGSSTSISSASMWPTHHPRPSSCTNHPPLSACRGSSLPTEARRSALFNWSALLHRKPAKCRLRMRRLSEPCFSAAGLQDAPNSRRNDGFLYIRRGISDRQRGWKGKMGAVNLE